MVLVVGLLCLAMAGCTSSHDTVASSENRSGTSEKPVGTVIHFPGEATVFVSGHAGCPDRLGQAGDVANDAAPKRRLLPVSAKPSAALVCAYTWSAAGTRAPNSGPTHTAGGATVPSVPSTNATPTPSMAPLATQSLLAGSVWLAAGDATRLSAVINRISLKSPTGPITCPADSGARIVLAFIYGPGRTVDLWFHPEGCQHLDNGDVAADEMANRSFYSDFDGAFCRMAGSAAKWLCS
jgi:hypothetical protein